MISRRRGMAVGTAVALIAAAVAGTLLAQSSTGKHPATTNTSSPSSAASGATPSVSTGAPSLTQLPQPVVNVTSTGAVPDGQTDDTAAIARAIARAQANGRGTVYFPRGQYLVGRGDAHASLRIATGPAITLAGAGMNSSKIIETSAKDLLAIYADGMTIQDLGLDTKTHSARACLVVVANHTTVQRVHVTSGSSAFAIYFAGPPGAKPLSPRYNVGNQVTDTVVEDGISDDGFSFSFQRSGLIRNIVHRGSRLALYIDQDVLVDGYQYSPGTQPTATDGFYITPPSSHITIENFVSTGNGGVIGTNPQPHTSRVSTAITIRREVLRQPQFQLRVADVDGLAIESSTLLGQVLFDPAVRASQVEIRNSILQAVTFSPAGTGAVDNPVFTDDTYEPVTTKRQGSSATFVSTSPAVSFTATGGQFNNQQGGLTSGSFRKVQANVAGA